MIPKDELDILGRTLPQWRSWNRVQWMVLTLQIVLVVVSVVLRRSQTADIAVYACIPLSFAATLVTFAKRKRCQRSLIALDYKACPRCLYDLRQLEDPMRCPECGQPVGPEQNFVNWRSSLAWWGSR